MNSKRSHIFLRKYKEISFLCLVVQLSVQFYGDDSGLERGIEGFKEGNVAFSQFFSVKASNDSLGAKKKLDQVKAGNE